MKYFIAFFLFIPSLFAHHDQKEMIKEMTGCYKIKFQSKETFSENPDYKFRDAYQSRALEWVFVDTESEDRLSLQHLLIVGPKRIVKHWRQDWFYEGRDLLDFEGDNIWTKRTLSTEEARGMWTQKVYQVDDSPRYECSAPWIHHGKKTYWECTANAPVPRREFSVRSDYNILRRTNRHEMTSYGWVHDQDNVKVLKKDGVQTKLAMEKSYNTYKKVDDKQCLDAQNWWKEHSRFWFDARSVWEEVTLTNERLEIKSDVYGQKLWQKLFALDRKYSASRNYDSREVRSEVKSVILSFLK